MSERLDALLREHAEKYDPAVLAGPGPAAIPDGETKSLYYRDLEERAGRQRTTVAALRVRDQERLASSQFPTPHCLKPGEVMLAVLNHRSLPSARWRHYEQCLFCQALVGMSRPDEASKADLLQKLAARTVEQPVAQRRESRRSPLALPIAAFGTAYAYLMKGLALTAAILVMLLVASDTVRQRVGSLMMAAGSTHRDTERWLMAAMHSSSRGEDDKVIELTNHVLGEDPSNSVALSLRGQAWRKLGMDDKAMADYRSLLMMAANRRETERSSSDSVLDVSDDAWDRLRSSERFRRRTGHASYLELATAYLLLNHKGANAGLPDKLLEALDARHADQRAEAASWKDLARDYSAAIGWHEAEPALGDPSTIREKALAAGWHHYACMSEIGEQLVQQAHYREAQPLVLLGYQGMKDHEGSANLSDQAALRQAATRVVGLYESWGKPDQAEVWRARVGLADLPTNVFADP